MIDFFKKKKTPDKEIPVHNGVSKLPFKEISDRPKKRVEGKTD